MYRKILLAYDGTVEGRRALREGARLAQTAGADVFLLAVVDVTPGIMAAESVYPGIVGQQIVFYDKALSDGVALLKTLGFSPSSKLVQGEPGPVIVAVAKEIGADLVAVGHHDQGVLARWWFGSVGNYLINHFSGSVLVSRMDVGDEEFHNWAKTH
ncbi:MAG TPA: universal stress protein [Verrucomicrobiae bacterium]|nr:universal stress protein [Verrucomicrobiae bacterium]